MLLLFWQISELDLESINVKLYFTSSMFDLFFCCCFVVDDFRHDWGGLSYFARA